MYNPKRKRGFCPKFQLPWDGPFVIIKRLSDVTYRIQRGVKGKPRIVHYNRLKPYKGEHAPTWLKDTEAPEIPETAEPHTSVTESNEALNSQVSSKDGFGSKETGPTEEVSVREKDRVPTVEQDGSRGSKTRRSQRNRRPPAKYTDECPLRCSKN